jgi:hypothetical protein
VTVRDEQGALTDYHGEPLYVSVQPVVGSNQPGIDPCDLSPGMEISVNGAQAFLYAGKAWALGLGLMRAAMCAELAPAALMEAGAEEASASVAFHVDGLPRVELDPRTGWGVGVTFVGASISVVHDAVIWRHLVGTRGLSDQEATDLLEGIETMQIQQFMESGNVRI